MSITVRGFIPYTHTHLFLALFAKAINCINRWIFTYTTNKIVPEKQPSIHTYHWWSSGDNNDIAVNESCQLYYFCIIFILCCAFFCSQQNNHDFYCVCDFLVTFVFSIWKLFCLSIHLSIYLDICWFVLSITRLDYIVCQRLILVSILSIYLY